MAPRLLPMQAPVRAYSQRDAAGYIQATQGPARTRARKGTSSLYAATQLAQSYDAFGGRLLTADELWTIYRTTPAIRSCVDSIVRRIASWAWDIKVSVKKDDPRYETAVELAAHCRRFYQAPCADGGLASTWQEYTTASTLDLIVFDQTASEKVRADDTGGVAELVAMLGPDVVPRIAPDGTLIKYDQLARTVTYGGSSSMGAGTVVRSFPPEDVVFLRLFASTSSVFGMPIIETIVNEAVTMLVSSEHAMLALDADEVPPGILVLGGLGVAAANRARAELRAMRGADHKIRVLAGPGATDAKWVPINRSPKDLDMIPVVEQTLRMIWRSFGVMPVEMGSEDATRAHAWAQVDVSQSHLVTPILNLVQTKQNMQVLPGVIRTFFPPGPRGDHATEVMADAVAFGFDRDAKLDPDQQKALAEAHAVYVRDGVLTRNEVRSELQRDPLEGGDIATVVASATTMMRLADLPDRLEAPDPAAAPPQIGGPTDGEDDDDDDEGDPDAGPGEADEAQKARHPDHVRADADYLPSDWPNAERFDGVRTLDLRALAKVIARYQRDVEDVWDAAVDATLAMVAAAYKERGLQEDEADSLLRQLHARVDVLTFQWEARGRPRYREAAKIGRDAVARWTNDADYAAGWEDAGEAYRQAAYGYLEQDTGPMAVVRARLKVVVDAMRVSNIRDRLLAMADRMDERITGEDLKVDVRDLTRVLEATAEAWRPQRHRSNAWTGKLNDLANKVMLDGLGQSESKTDARWYGEWVDARDTAECMDCLEMGALGFVKLSTFQGRRPGDTKCGARCRCALVIWAEQEVVSGHAVKFNPER